MTEKRYDGYVAPGSWWEREGPKVLRALLVVPLLLAVWFFTSLGDDEEDETELHQIEAVMACESHIKSRLKAPSTADLNLDTDDTGPTYTVRGTVDAENSFGGKLRSNVTCAVTRNGNESRVQSLTGLR